MNVETSNTKTDMVVPTLCFEVTEVRYMTENIVSPQSRIDMKIRYTNSENRETNTKSTTGE